METQFDLEQNNADELMSLAEFIEHFNVHFRLLLRRYARFKEIDDVFNTDIDVLTYLDMIVVQLRAKEMEKECTSENVHLQLNCAISQGGCGSRYRRENKTFANRF